MPIEYLKKVAFTLDPGTVQGSVDWVYDNKFHPGSYTVERMRKVPLVAFEDAMRVHDLSRVSWSNPTVLSDRPFDVQMILSEAKPREGVLDLLRKTLELP